MSGGSMDYAYLKVEEAVNRFEQSTPERKAFRAHLVKIAAAMRAIEWNDSGDGANNEDALIRACLAPGATLAAVVDEAVRVSGELAYQIAKAREVVK